MTKIEELKAAYDAAAQGEWDWHQGTNDNGDEFVTVEYHPDEFPEEAHIILSELTDLTEDVEFIALAHNTMPTLIEVAQAMAGLHAALKAIGYGEDEDIKGADLVDLMQSHFDRVQKLMEKLK